MNEKILIDRSVVEQVLEAFYGLLTYNTSNAEYAAGRSAIKSLRSAMSHLHENESLPFGYMYGNKTGFRTTHWVDWLGDDIRKKQLANDMQVARDYPNAHWVVPLYTHAQPPRQPLTDEEILKLGWAVTPYANQMEILAIARAIERAHKIGGEA